MADYIISEIEINCDECGKPIYIGNKVQYNAAQEYIHLNCKQRATQKISDIFIKSCKPEKRTKPLVSKWSGVCEPELFLREQRQILKYLSNEIEDQLEEKLRKIVDRHGLSILSELELVYYPSEISYEEPYKYTFSQTIHIRRKKSDAQNS